MFNSCDNAKGFRDGADGFPQNTKAEIRELTVASELGSIAATDYLKNEEENLKSNLSDCSVTAEQKWTEAAQLGRQIASGIVQRYEAKGL